ncbi:hypothetical protein [Candidatus Enterovibrio escicola]|uniref:hypothetical protein n=1 Tax=Candidatus Enterovibrio escicola TaxID=1927127 RepID=UPI001237F6DF
MMGKVKHKINNWKQYNQALVNLGSMTFWINDAAIKAWLCQSITVIMTVNLYLSILRLKRH